MHTLNRADTELVPILVKVQFLQARLQTLLGLSNKESCKAFFYASAECLEWTQRLMLKLWSYLLTQAEHLPYKHQPGIFETLHLLVQRGELDHAALFDAAPQLMERYSRTLWDTVAYVMAKLNRKAAPTEVRVFCSQALAIALMRLPALRGQARAPAISALVSRNLPRPRTSGPTA